MGGGRAPKDPPDKEEERPSPSSSPWLPPSLAGVRLADAPILLLVYFHEAIRTELSELRRVAVAAAADEKSESHSREFAVELSGRFEFLKLFCKYHCAAEDEVSSGICIFILFGMLAKKKEKHRSPPFQIKGTNSVLLSSLDKIFEIFLFPPFLRSQTEGSGF